MFYKRVIRWSGLDTISFRDGQISLVSMFQFSSRMKRLMRDKMVILIYLKGFWVKEQSKLYWITSGSIG